MIVKGDLDTPLALLVDGVYSTLNLADLLFEAWSAGISKEDLHFTHRSGSKEKVVMNVLYGEYTSDSIFK